MTNDEGRYDRSRAATQVDGGTWLLDVTPESLRPFALGRLPRAFRLAHQMCWRPSFDRRYGGSTLR